MGEYNTRIIFKKIIESINIIFVNVKSFALCFFFLSDRNLYNNFSIIKNIIQE